MTQRKTPGQETRGSSIFLAPLTTTRLELIFPATGDHDRHSRDIDPTPRRET